MAVRHTAKKLKAIAKLSDALNEINEDRSQNLVCVGKIDVLVVYEKIGELRYDCERWDYFPGVEEFHSDPICERAPVVEPTPIPDQIEVFWNSNSDNEHWAWRGRNEGRIIAGGKLEDHFSCDNSGTVTWLEDAVVEVARWHGITIDCGSVGVDSLYACWTRCDDADA